MTDYTNDIKRYLNGEMTPAEMHALEKKALSDPFLSDALEGASSMGANDFASEITAINSRIEEQAIAGSEVMASRTAAQPASSAAEKPVVHRLTVTGWAMRIAAGLILLAAATFVIWQFSKQTEDEPLALNKTFKDNNESQSEEDSSADKDLAPIGNIETTPAAEKAGPDPQDKSGSGVSTYPAEQKAKTQDVLADAKPKLEAKKDDHAGEFETQPVLAEAPKAKEQVGELRQTEKPVELAAADEREEGKLEKRDVRADDDRKKVAGIARSSVQQNQTIIQGKVTSSEDGTPLPGVNVVIKGTSIGTITDAGGNYQIESTQVNPSLVYSFIGLQSQEVPAGDRRQVDVQMALDVAQLSEVVVTGYGIQNATPYTPTVELAHPSTGNRAFKQYLESSVRYPKEALEKKIEGRVTVEFFVEPDGALTNFILIRGIGEGCDEELIRLIKEGPKWEPSKKDGVPIRDKVRVRLKFELPKKP